MERCETAAFVLHSEPVGEQGLMLDLISPTYGRIKVWSRHARSRRSQVKAMVQLFSPLNITFKHDGEGRVMCGCAAAGMPFSFEPPYLFTALYLNELSALIFREEGEGPIFFAAYLRALTALAVVEKTKYSNDFEINVEIERVLRNFELDAIACSGFDFDWRFDCNDGSRIEPQRRYVLEPNNGFRAYLLGENIDSRLVFVGEEISAVANREFDGIGLRSAKRICRFLISHLLEGRSLNSRQLYLDYLKALK